MATEVVKFSPFWTQGRDGGSLILDRNLAAIAKALENANTTFVRVDASITNIIDGTTPIALPATQVAFGSATNTLTSDAGLTYSTGVLSVASLGAPGGLVKAAAVTGALSNATAGTDYEVPLTFSTGLTRTVNTITANLSTGIAGGQSAIGGTAGGNNLTLSSTTNGTKGKILFGTSAYDEVNNRLGIKTAAPGFALDVNGDANVGGNATVVGHLTMTSAASYIDMPNADGSGATTDGWIISAGRNLLGMTSGNITVLSASVAGGGEFRFVTGGSTANNLFSIDNAGIVATPTSLMKFTRSGVQLLEKQGTGDFYVGTLSTQLLGLYTNNITRVSIDGTTGGVTLSSLASGLVKATAGLLAIASASDVAGAITWPAANRVLVSSGTTTAPIGNSAFQWDDTNRVLFMGAGATQAWSNLGNLGAANSEYVEAAWATNVFALTSKKTGTGTVRAMKITTTAGVTVDEYLQVNGPTAPANVAFITGKTTNSTRDHVQFFVGGGGSPDTPSNAFFDVNPAGTTVGTGNNGGVLATVRIRSLTYTGSGGPSPAESTALYVDNQPSLSGVTGNQYAIHVAAGLSLFDGNVSFNGNAASFGGSCQLGFFGTGVQAQQTVTGSRAGNAALASLLTKLATYGLIVDSSTA